MFEMFGILGGAIIVLSWVPEILKVLKNRSSKDVSIIFLLTILLGTILLLIYSFYISDVIYITINSLAAILVTILIIIAYKYRPP